ncbi:M1 family metallopeptidase [Candidatus Saccharibacteria bacterium]|nr:M1 family metallopeptidase [Candidatus Saccharibacteria bacterium]
MERFLDYFVPEKYDLDLGVDKFLKQIGGTVTIYGEAKAETVKIHAVGLEVEQVIVDDKEATYEVQDGVLTLKNVPRGVCTIIIGYHGSLNENMQGAYLSTYQHKNDTEIIVATQFESHYAREAFPCIDEPAAKAIFNLRLTVPDTGDLVLANTELIDTHIYHKVPDGKYTVFYSDNPTKSPRKSATKYLKYTFAPTPRMSTYLLAWVIGKFHGKTVKNAHGTEITTYCAMNQPLDSVDFANDIAAKSLEFYDDNFGVPYPLKKCTQVALPDFEAGAMENWGLVTYRETMLLAGGTATLGTKKGIALTVAHELSHQWFGDLVTMQWWDDLWLNESFASVMEYYAVDYIHPEYKIFEGFFTGDCLAALRRDCLTGVQSVHQDVKSPEEIATLFDPAIVYSKGARLMLMTIRLMGWDDFCRGIREYFDKYQYHNTVGDDLWDALAPHAKFDVKSMMHSFIDAPGYPVVSSAGTDFTSIAQKRFLLDSALEPSHWTLPEIREDMSGHYILNLSDKEFEERLSRFDKLGLEEKLRLLIDKDLTTKTSLASSATLLPLIAKFSDENSAAVWNIILTIVAGLKIFFDHGSKDEKLYKKFIKNLVRPKLAEIGLVTRDGDDENILRLRSILLGLDFYASTFTDDKADVANLKVLADLYDRDFAKIDSEIRSDVIDANFYLKQNLFDDYLASYKAIADPEIKFDLLFAMTLAHDEAVCDKVLSLLEQPEIVKPQDQFSLFIYLYRNPCLKPKAFTWLTGHWDYVKSLAGDKSLDHYPRYTAASVRTEAEYHAWLDFFEPLSSDPALARAIEVGKHEISARLALITDDGADVRSTLQNLDF